MCLLRHMMNTFSTTSCPSSLSALSSLRAKLMKVNTPLKMNCKKQTPTNIKHLAITSVIAVFYFVSAVKFCTCSPALSPWSQYYQGKWYMFRSWAPRSMKICNSLMANNWMVKHKELRFCLLLSADTMTARDRALLENNSIKWNELCWKLKTTGNLVAFPLEMPSVLLWLPAV